MNKFRFERNGITYNAVEVDFDQVNDFIKKNPDYKIIDVNKNGVYLTDEVIKYMNFEIDIFCRDCGKTHTISVIEDDYWLRLENKVAIQKCFPYLSREDREAFISHLCSDCQRKIFSMNY